MPNFNGIDNQEQNIQVIQDANKIHDPPPGTTFNDDERALWEYIMGARLYRRWTHADLFLAVRVVRIESRLRLGYERLDELVADGQDIFDEECEAHRYYNNILKAEKHMFSTVRMLGLTRSPTPTPDPERNLQDQKVQQMREAVNVINGVMSEVEDAVEASNQKRSVGMLALE